MKIEAKVQKWGNGLAIRIAGVMRDIPHFQNGTPIEVEVNEDGLIIKKMVKAGEMAMPSVPAFILTDLSKLLIKADISEANLNDLKIEHLTSASP